MLESLFNKVAAFQIYNFIKKRLQHMCFSVKFAKFLSTPFFTEHLQRVLLYRLEIRFWTFLQVNHSQKQFIIKMVGIIVVEVGNRNTLLSWNVPNDQGNAIFSRTQTPHCLAFHAHLDSINPLNASAALIKTSQLICYTNQLHGFYMRATLASI